MKTNNPKPAGISLRSKGLVGICDSRPTVMFDLDDFTDYYTSTRCAKQCTPQDTDCQRSALGITLEACTEDFKRPYAYCADYADKVFNSEILPIMNLYS